MKTVKLILFLLFAASATYAQVPHRTVAITIDDLPVVSSNTALKHRKELTRKLLGHVTRAKVPAIGFVNENKLYVDGNRDERQVDLLRMWLDAGLDLGNHTFSHRSLHQIDREEYQADLLKGEPITKELLAAKGMQMRFFRHPYLQTGQTLELKEALRGFLDDHAYTIAPVTIDNGDYIFASAYEKASAGNDKKLAKQVGEAYVPYMERKVAYWERQSVKLFDREISQILLMHANAINAEYFGRLAAMFKRRGYKFVKLETALKDKAYKQPDRFIGNGGISWLHRWALSRGKSFVVDDEPEVPKFVLKLSGFDSE